MKEGSDWIRAASVLVDCKRAQFGRWQARHVVRQCWTATGGFDRAHRAAGEFPSSTARWRRAVVAGEEAPSASLSAK